MANSIMRGTTPTMALVLPFSTAELANAWVTFSQKGKEVLNKEIGSPGFLCEDKTITIHLAQEETLLFEDGFNVQIQLRVRSLTGEALGSQVISVHVEEILKDGVI